jgi:hypothetical protein
MTEGSWDPGEDDDYDDPGEIEIGPVEEEPAE